MNAGDLVDEVSFVVEEGKIREFARATRVTDPRQLRGEIATATHSVVTGHSRDQSGFADLLGLSIARVVVGSVSWEYGRPLAVGDALTATRRLESDVRRDGRSGPMRFVTLATSFTDAGGDVVLVQREVLIERGVLVDGGVLVGRGCDAVAGPSVAGAAAPAPVAAGPAAAVSPVTALASPVPSGPQGVPLAMLRAVPAPHTTAPVSRTDIVRFAGAGGDFNPLHHDTAAAQASGFPDVIAMGQYQAGLLAGHLTDWVGVECLRRYEVRFVSPVQLGDELTLSAVLGEVAHGSITVSLTATAGERVVVTAEAIVAVE